MNTSIYTRIGAELCKQAGSAKEPVETALSQLFELLGEQLKGDRLQSSLRAGRGGLGAFKDSDFFLRRQAQAKAFVSFALGGPSAYTPRDFGRILGRGGMAASDFEIMSTCLPALLGNRGLSLSSVQEVQDALKGALSRIEHG